MPSSNMNPGVQGFILQTEERNQISLFSDQKEKNACVRKMHSHLYFSFVHEKDQ